jgi:hypothetical protein
MVPGQPIATTVFPESEPTLGIECPFQYTLEEKKKFKVTESYRL